MEFTVRLGELFIWGLAIFALGGVCTWLFIFRKLKITERTDNEQLQRQINNQICY